MSGAHSGANGSKAKILPANKRVFKKSYQKFAKKYDCVETNLREFHKKKSKRPPVALGDTFKEHALQGKYKKLGVLERHLAPAALLLYKDLGNVVLLIKVVSHDELCGRRGKVLADQCERLIETCPAVQGTPQSARPTG